MDANELTAIVSQCIGALSQTLGQHQAKVSIKGAVSKGEVSIELDCYHDDPQKAVEIAVWLYDSAARDLMAKGYKVTAAPQA